jgi:hypothetical protein
MAAKEKEQEAKEAPIPVGKWLPAVALAWIVPGGGHLLLKRRGRAALLLAPVVLMFLFGIFMRGSMFSPQFGDLFALTLGRLVGATPQNSDLLSVLINCGGFLGNLSSGFLYLMASMLGYNQPDMAGAVYDYGTKFLVSAGLLNVLAMVDAFEIAIGKKS